MLDEDYRDVCILCTYQICSVNYVTSDGDLCFISSTRSTRCRKMSVNMYAYVNIHPYRNSENGRRSREKVALMRYQKNRYITSTRDSNENLIVIHCIFIQICQLIYPYPTRCVWYVECSTNNKNPPLWTGVNGRPRCKRTSESSINQSTQ